MQSRVRLLVFLALLQTLSGCGGGGASDPLPTPTGTLSGKAQKGPFSTGARFTVYRLSPSGMPGSTPEVSGLLSADGRYFLGNLSPGIFLVEIRGKYFNELTRAESTAEVTLHHVIEVKGGERKAANVNALTHLASAITLGWMQQGVSFDEAKTRAFLAVNDAFSTALNLSTGLDFDQLDLHSAGETRDHATLFALSSLLLLAADGSNPDGLNQLLERLSRSIRDTARMSSEDHAALREAVRRVRPADVVAGLNSFASGRTPIPLDALDSVIDSDLDGQVNTIDADDDEDGLADSDELQAGSDQLNADSDGDGLPDGRDATPVLFELVVPDQELALPEDSSAVINVDAENHGLAQSYAVVQAPTLGSLTGTFPLLTYTPGPNQHGSDEFRYTLRRDSYTSRIVNVRIRVDPVPDAPTLARLGPLTIKAFENVSIDLAPGDVDGDQVTVNFADLPAWLTYDTVRGVLQGRPTNADLGVHGPMAANASDGISSVSSGAFTVTVNFQSLLNERLPLNAPGFTGQSIQSVQSTTEHIYLIIAGSTASNLPRVLVKKLDLRTLREAWSTLLPERITYPSYSSLKAGELVIVGRPDAGRMGYIATIDSGGSLLRAVDLPLAPSTPFVFHSGFSHAGNGQIHLLVDERSADAMVLLSINPSTSTFIQRTLPVTPPYLSYYGLDALSDGTFLTWSAVAPEPNNFHEFHFDGSGAELGSQYLLFGATNVIQVERGSDERLAIAGRIASMGTYLRVRDVQGTVLIDTSWPQMQSGGPRFTFHANGELSLIGQDGIGDTVPRYIRFSNTGTLLLDKQLSISGPGLVTFFSGLVPHPDYFLLAVSGDRLFTIGADGSTHSTAGN